MSRGKHCAEEALWKQRFESLLSDLADMEITARNKEFERSPTRAWDAVPEVFVSFSLDCVCDEPKAIELFGEGNYDVYKLVRTGRDPYERTDDGEGA